MGFLEYLRSLCVTLYRTQQSPFHAYIAQKTPVGAEKLLSELAIEGADRPLTSTRVQELLATDAGMDGKGCEE